jgi:hypothetical protein
VNIRSAVLAGFLALLAYGAWSQPFMYRPGQELRTVSTESYEMSIQKNGRLDITLSSGEQLIDDAYPMVWLEGDARPREMDVKGKRSFRQEVNTALGKGQGLVLESKEGLWVLQTYPTKPFLVAQILYTNQGRQPVHVRALLPWCVGGRVKGDVSLGPGTDRAWILAPWPESSAGTLLPELRHDSGSSLWSLALYNPATHMSLTTGFLTYPDGHGVVRVSRDDRSPGFSSLTSEYVFDPPVEVPPGGTLASGHVYVGLAEEDVFTGLERLAVATSLANELERRPVLVPQSWAAGSIAEAPQAALARLRTDVQPYGWNTVIATPRSEESIEEVSSAIRAAGFSVGLDLTSRSAAEPESYARHAPDLMLLARIDPMTALDTTAAVALSGPAWRTGQTTSLVYTTPETAEGWGSLAEAMGAAMGRYFMVPWLGRPLMPAVELGPGSALTPDQRRAVLTAMAMLGGSMRLAGDPDGWTAQDLATVQRLLPLVEKPARPVDLFGEHRPRVLALDLSGPAGDWLIFGLFNWDSVSTEIPLELAAFGGDAGQFYTVYDFWDDLYLGTAQHRLNVAVPAGACRVLGLRPHRDEPMVLGLAHSVTLGALAFQDVSWNRAARQLEGGLEGGARPFYDLRVLAPEGWSATDIAVTGGTATLSQDGRLTRARLTSDKGGRLAWKVRF